MCVCVCGVVSSVSTSQRETTAGAVVVSAVAGARSGAGGGLQCAPVSPRVQCPACVSPQLTDGTMELLITASLESVWFPPSCCEPFVYKLQTFKYYQLKFQ